MSELESVRARYERFALEEAPGRSALYAAWAGAVRDDDAVAAVIARIPEAHRQPPLVFAVARRQGCPSSAGAEWAHWIIAHADALVAECAVRSIQTNEPLRCAALLPALSLIDGPIALLEVGASAGLCLYPDRYSYSYRTRSGTVRLEPASGPSQVVLDCELRGAPEMRMPEIVWRGGIDLAPLDAGDPGDRSWLTGMVWPGETGREQRISAALDIVAADPPLLVAGDGAEALPALAARAPAGATLVVTTPGVLPYIPRRRRAAFVDAARGAGRWVTMDAPATHDGWRAPLAGDVPPGAFVLALDGVALAAVDPLGAWVEWRADGAPSAR